ncbi:mechanosensitive ion channel family protein [Neolewinella sp.]|uniref:mechanosensitive ion channel family protein n=1 Tax=Neolewinella sp. TaxID=2993543 RepID=UPI003B52E07C
MESLHLTTQDITWIIFVTLTVALLWSGAHFGIRMIIRRLEARGRKPVVLPTIRKILKVFVLVLGAGLISYAFLDHEQFAAMNQNILRVTWIAFVMMATIIVSAVVSAFFERRIKATSARDRQDTTTYKYLNSLATVGIYATGIILTALAIPAARDLATTALTGAGVLALIIGVAAQEAFANVIGGLFIAFFKPFRLGDVIKVTDTVGRVEDLTLRHTVINNFQNKCVVIPNAIINKEKIENYTLTEYRTCEFVEIGISYDSDIDRAMTIMREEATAHDYLIDNRSEREKKDGKPVVDVQVIGLGDSSVNLRAWVWAATYVTGFRMRNDLYKSIKQRFDREGIEIPFPHRTLVHKNLAAKLTATPAAHNSHIH